MMKKAINYLFISALLLIPACTRVDDSLLIDRIYTYALTHDEGFENLRYLCKNTPGRLAGSATADTAVAYIFKLLKKMDLDSVYLQEVMVPHWYQGDQVIAKLISSIVGTKTLSICALGPSVATSEKGITAPVIEVRSLDTLKMLGKEKVTGKIVFFNRPMNPTLINTMTAYSQAVDQRVHGAGEAAKYGAVGVLVRSITTRLDDFPHTGVMRYEPGIAQIPAAAVSTLDADVLSRSLQLDSGLTCFLRMNCADLGEKQSYNIIGEIRGTKHPEQIILAGAHLDAWFTGEGAHDDGAGCIHVIDLLRIYKQLSLHPNHTIRSVLYMDEEMNQTGGKQYAADVTSRHEKYIAAIESDRGGLLPLGFTIDSQDRIIKNFMAFKKHFLPYGILRFEKGYGGVDINFLKELDIPLIGLLPDTQRYFDYHHSANDTFEQVHLRELQLGSAAIASLVYLIDKYGLQ
jgi:carboxypeptidase Q